MRGFCWLASSLSSSSSYIIIIHPVYTRTPLLCSSGVHVECRQRQITDRRSMLEHEGPSELGVFVCLRVYRLPRGVYVALPRHLRNSGERQEPGTKNMTRKRKARKPSKSKARRPSKSKASTRTRTTTDKAKSTARSRRLEAHLASISRKAKHYFRQLFDPVPFPSQVRTRRDEALFRRAAVESYEERARRLAARDILLLAAAGEPVVCCKHTSRFRSQAFLLNAEARRHARRPAAAPFPSAGLAAGAGGHAL